GRRRGHRGPAAARGAVHRGGGHAAGRGRAVGTATPVPRRAELGRGPTGARVDPSGAGRGAGHPRAGPRELGSRLPSLRAAVELPLERPLNTPRATGRLNSAAVTDEPAAGLEDMVDLFDTSAIDLGALQAAVMDTVAAHGGVASLAQVVTAHPLTD